MIFVGSSFGLHQKLRSSSSESMNQKTFLTLPVREGNIELAKILSKWTPPH